MEKEREVLSISIKDIEEARKRLAPPILRTPLITLDLEGSPAEIYLKAENLQPTGSFKVRGAGNVIALLSSEERKKGVYTCSAGNMAQALAWHSSRQGIPCTVIVPDTAPETKLDGIKRFGAEIVQLPWEGFWKVALSHGYPPLKERVFVHPFSDNRMIAGNGTIGLEILEDLPDADSIVVPFGGGGLVAGIATAVKAKRPQALIYACEPESAAPLAASLAAGSPKHVRRIPSFIDGSGASDVLPEMWALLNRTLSGSLVVSLRETAAAIGLIFERHRMIAEGAGALSLAAALSGRAGTGRVVCVISGGNIDSLILHRILAGETP